ncbi:hypothetical protein [Mycoplasmopsis bovis]|uniref:hypothetical protein n=1 Tax=Mycoplasmopsis bovis TaxID=28903 RepID=UPI001CF32D19|nr:hypothetical protein [Mycoplasmopsis bovis]UCP05851.1 hypothetical protein JNG56_04310 [Mycoplasmopsis bovis]
MWWNQEEEKKPEGKIKRKHRARQNPSENTEPDKNPGVDKNPGKNQTESDLKNQKKSWKAYWESIMEWS